MNNFQFTTRYYLEIMGVLCYLHQNVWSNDMRLSHSLWVYE